MAHAKLYDEADQESTEWEVFLQTWLEKFGDRAISTKEFCENLAVSPENLAVSPENLAGSLIDVLPEYLQASYTNDKESVFKIKLGRQLEKRVDACFGEQNLHLEKLKDNHTKLSVWKVVAGSAGSPTTYVRNEKFASDCDSQIDNKKNKNSIGMENYPHSPQAPLADTIPHSGLNGSTSGVKPDFIVSDTADGLPANLPLPARLPANETEYEEYEV